MGRRKAQQRGQGFPVGLVLDRSQLDKLAKGRPEGVVVRFGSGRGVAAGQEVVRVVLVGSGGARGDLLLFFVVGKVKKVRFSRSRSGFFLSRPFSFPPFFFLTLSISIVRLTSCLLITLTTRDSCRISLETFKGKSAESTIPRTKLAQRGNKSPSNSSEIKTLFTKSLTLREGLSQSCCSKGAMLGT